LEESVVKFKCRFDKQLFLDCHPCSQSKQSRWGIC